MSRRRSPKSPGQRAELDKAQMVQVRQLQRYGHDAVSPAAWRLVLSTWRCDPANATKRRDPAKELLAAAAMLTFTATCGTLILRAGMHDLALELGVPYRTVQRAHKWLRDQGLLLRRHRGTKETGVSLWKLPMPVSVRILGAVKTSMIERRQRFRPKAERPQPVPTQRATKAHVVHPCSPTDTDRAHTGAEAARPAAPPASAEVRKAAMASLRSLLPRGAAPRQYRFRDTD
jgi:hypothetical protein